MVGELDGAEVVTVVGAPVDDECGAAEVVHPAARMHRVRSGSQGLSGRTAASVPSIIWKVPPIAGSWSISGGHSKPTRTRRRSQSGSLTSDCTDKLPTISRNVVAS